MSRSHETQVEIDAPIEVVWKALTEAEEIARWFAPLMQVEPGAGGSMVADWGPGLEWKTAIEVWEPNRHLRLTEVRDRVLSSSTEEQSLEPCRLIQDYYLESANGKTVLRLVHSGFGSSDGWDLEYDGTRAGWASCFLRLQHLLERHRNEPVHNSIVTHIAHGFEWQEAIARIEAGFSDAIPVILRNKYHLSYLLPELHGSILTFSVQPSAEGCLIYIELLLFSSPRDRARAIEGEWRSNMAEWFPAPVHSNA